MVPTSTAGTSRKIEVFFRSACETPQARVVTPRTKSHIRPRFQKRVRWKGYKKRDLYGADRRLPGNAPIKIEQFE
jgi:hypothetical protein